MRFFRAFLPALLVLAILAVPSARSDAAVAVGISVNLAPPPLPVYEQPLIPGPGYIWTPGYWAWGPEGYYWVPGTWVYPPTVGLYWTPPWWGWSDGVYLFHAGYWGPEVGFYGGIDYGYGYFGHGYEGGYWNHGHFFYNREVNNIRNVNITNVYDRRVRDTAMTQNRVAFNGGPGGVSAQATAQERTALSRRHFGPTALQQRQITAARSNRGLWASANHGQPSVTATSLPGRFNATTRSGGAAATTHRGVTVGARNFVNTGRTGTMSRATPNVQRTPRNVTATTPGRFGSTTPRKFGSPTPRGLSASTPRAPTPSAPRFVQHQPTRSFSQGAPGRFGPGRNASIQRGPSPSVSRGAPAHFGSGPVARAPAATVSHGAPARGGHAAPANPRERH